MYGINFVNDNISYKYSLPQAIEKLCVLIEKEYTSSIYFDSLLKSAVKEDDRQILRSIIKDENQHIEALRKLYLELTG